MTQCVIAGNGRVNPCALVLFNGAISLGVLAGICPAAVIAHWRFDVDASDATGDHSAALAGGALISSDGGAISGQSLVLDGDGDYVTIPYSADFELASGTISFWFRGGPSASQRPLVSLIDWHHGSAHSGGPHSWTFQGCSDTGLPACPGGSLIFGDGPFAVFETVTNPLLDDATFHHVVATFQASGAGWMYIDGLPVHSAPFPGFVYVETEAITIGRWGAAVAQGSAANARDYLGRIDDVQMYDHALDADQVTYLFSNPGKALPLFVDVDAVAGENDGTSWANAYIHLQDALDDAEANPAVTEIWVAEGTYMPDGGYKPVAGAHVPGSGSRSTGFLLLTGVAIYGGFAGVETLLSQRDIEANPTILSGDLLGDDAPVACSQNSPDCNGLGGLCLDGTCIINGNNADNSFTVIASVSATPATVIDGFTVTAANTDGGGGGGFFNAFFEGVGAPTISNCIIRGNLASGSGGGMFNNGASPTITGCTFTRNAASSGGGIRNGNNANPTVTNCTFDGNSAYSGDGGGMYHSDATSPIVANSTFMRNRAAGNGGGLLLNSTGGSKALNCRFLANSAVGSGGGIYNSNALVVANCLFAGNTAGFHGAGMYTSLGTTATLQVINSTFGANTATFDGGGIYNNNSSPSIENSILWGNIDSGGVDSSAQIHTQNGSPELFYSIVEGGWSGAGGTGVVNADPLFVDADGADNIPGTEDDNLRLQPGSPAIDAGDNTALPADVADLDGDMITAEQIPFDLAGNPRRVPDPFTPDTGNGAPPIVDMGAYEFGAHVLFVDAGAVGAENGSSWVNAFKYLRDALAYAEGNPQIAEVWVAAGTYTPKEKSCTVVADCGGPPNICAPVGMCIWDNQRVQTFQLQSGVVIHGGFAGNETQLSQRNVSANPTMLSGDLAGDDVPVPCAQDSPDCNSFGGLCVNGSCIIRSNNTENSYHVVTGSGTDATAGFNGFTVTAGNANGSNPNDRGAGMYNFSGSPVVVNCIFTGNTVMERGGGIYNESSSNPAMTGCIIRGNATGSADGNFGGGMFNVSSHPVLNYCSFIQNFSDDGAGVFNFSGSNPEFSNCTFQGNRAEDIGGAMRNLNSSPALVNCRFRGNTAQYGGGLVTDAGSPTLTNCTFSVNSATLLGGGMLNLTSGSPVVTNCTFTGNSTNGDGGGMWYDGSSPLVTNCILWNNSDSGGTDESAQIHVASGAPEVNYSIVHGGWSGAGSNNLNANPLFFDPDGVDGIIGTADDDLRLQPSSPAIDAGDTTALPLDTLDLDGDLNTTEYVPFDLAGNARQFDDPDTVDTGVPGSPVVDMGAYEYFTDCNGNSIVDAADIAGPGSDDCNSSGWASNGIPDECDIAACDGDPGCEDCNLNGIPDGCDIGAATSVDADLDDIPDECVFFTAACNPPTDEWSCFDNWDIPDEVYPDNVGGNTYSVVLTGGADDVCLDVSVTIDTLKVEKNATLRVTQPDPACIGALSGHAAMAAGPAVTMEIVEPGGLEVDATLSVAGSNEIDVTSGAMVVGPDGVYAADAEATGAVSANLQAAEVRIVGDACYSEPCADGGRVELTDSMSLTVFGDLIIDGRLANGECDFDHRPSSDAEAQASGPQLARSFHTPPVKITRNDSAISIFGGIHLLGAAGSINESSVPVSLGGDFDNQSTRPDCFDWSLGGLILVGETHQSFEVASPDVGEIGGRGPTPPFFISSLSITDGANVTLRDFHDNDLSGQGSCTEALYVGTLTIGANATLTLENCRIYAASGAVDPTANINYTGCATVVGVPLEPDPVVAESPAVGKVRHISFVVPATSSGTDTALRVVLTSLHHPPSPPPGTPNFAAHEGGFRYVNSFSGGSTTCVDSNTFATNFRCGQLGCQPEYRDWAAELQSVTNPPSTAGLIHITGDAVVPSSTLSVSHIAAACGAAPAANACASASAALAVSTARWGDVGSGGGGAPDGNTNVIDIGLVVDNVKGLATAIPERRAWMKNPPNTFLNPVNVIDIGLTVDSVKGLPYPYTIAACP